MIGLLMNRNPLNELIVDTHSCKRNVYEISVQGIHSFKHTHTYIHIKGDRMNLKICIFLGSIWNGNEQTVTFTVYYILYTFFLKFSMLWKKEKKSTNTSRIPPINYGQKDWSKLKFR